MKYRIREWVSGYRDYVIEAHSEAGAIEAVVENYVWLEPGEIQVQESTEIYAIDMEEVE